MPISICENEEQLNHWCEQFVKGSKYIVYYTTEDSEVILEPIRSTRPLRYCYLKMSTSNSAKKVATQISKTYELPLLEIKRMAWDLEKGPGIRMPIGER
jgi:uncharacterized lipoprotein YehR (DUF1307 family)